jgi:hypothetical protein
MFQAIPFPVFNGFEIAAGLAMNKREISVMADTLEWAPFTLVELALIGEPGRNVPVVKY